MHEAGYRALGLDYRYVPFEIDDLEGAVRAMRALGIRGLGISMPFKQAIVPMLDALEPVAAAIGAINTVVNDAGRLTGHNTDWQGAVAALEERVDLNGTPVLLLGAGGAAAAVAHGLRQRGAALSLCSRRDEVAQALAARCGARHRAWEARHDTREVAVVVNASSAGMADVDPQSPLAEEALRRDLVVMDIVYKPLKTQLLAAAAAKGATVIDGSRMLLHQAARQFELYTGEAAPSAAMDAALAAQLGA
ncbi:MAG: shikimate dehydrogenase [Myxococcales bacterium]|nr:shikimate dehydrogenase [Myxococcales bacterium]